jgi:hypothetical protein
MDESQAENVKSSSSIRPLASIASASATTSAGPSSGTASAATYTAGPAVDA